MKFSSYFFYFLAISLCFSCQENASKKKTYLGGEIVNPKEDFVIISKNDELLDTITLNATHEFGYTFPEGAHGLYKIQHPPESQIFYLEEGDSLMLRLNTMEFDESLVYSAEGAAENNFLMEMYLLNEKNNNLIFSYYKISPEEFNHKIDSVKQKRIQRFHKLDEAYNFSDEFKQIALKTIDYEYYDLHERYSFLINKYFQDNKQQPIPKKFFNYRKSVNFNDKQLQVYYIYQHFLDNYLKNRSIEYCIVHNATRDCYSLSNVKNLERRMVIADSLFTLKNLRYHFLNRFSRKSIIYSENTEQIDTTLTLIKKFNLPKKNWDLLKQLATLQRTYFIGNNISNKKLLTSDLHPIILKNIIQKPTIVFSWSIYSPAIHILEHEKMNQLRNRYPEINFIGLNIDDRETHLWKKTLENFDYNQDFEYQLRDTGTSKPLYMNYLDKIMFINKKGEIIYGNIQLDDPNFENYILEFLNQ